MIFRRFETGGLAHYSYLVACPETGRAAVVDPRRDVDVYLDALEDADLSLAHVTETHIHADYASGARELAARTGAEVALSGFDADERYEVRWKDRALDHGDRIDLETVCLEALHTPGHTPEHLTFAVHEETADDRGPSALLTGDFLLVGSVGRPDLLGEEATRELARRLYVSLRSTLSGLPDEVAVHPAHGAGSFCGSGIGGAASSTLGAERTGNPYLDAGLSREAFLEKLLSDLPVRPDYYFRMKRLNADGPPLVGGDRSLSALGAGEVARRLQRGAVPVDVRSAEVYGAGHLPDSVALPGGDAVASWGALVVPYEQPLVLVTASGGQVDGEAEEAARMLRRVGHDEVVGYLAGGVPAWEASGRPVRTTPQLTPDEVAEERDGGARVIDVRTASERLTGHIPGSLHVPASDLASMVSEVGDRERPVVLYCASGYRSTVAASVLERSGFTRVYNAVGGMTRWKRARRSVT